MPGVTRGIEDRSATADVVVIGAGMAGLCAAARAAQSGARVVVLERAPAIGGSAFMSHGNVWTAAEVGQLAAEDPGEFRVHAGQVVTDFGSVADWLAGFGGALESRKSSRRRQWQRFDIPLTFLRLVQLVTAAGGEVRTGVRVTDVDKRSETGSSAGLGNGADPVNGADLGEGASMFSLTIEQAGNQPKSGGGTDEQAAQRPGTSAIHARSLVIATGGRQADAAVRNELAGPQALLRGNPYSDGGGIAIAVTLGAAVNLSNRGFYGHLLPAGVTPLCPLDFLALTLYHSTHSVLFDLDGRRFTDESLGDARNAIALGERGGQGILLWSQAVQHAAATDPAPVDMAIDRWQFACDRGARVARAESASEVDSILRSWGLPARPEGEPLPPELGNGPVFLAQVRPGITFTYGGLRADTRGQVLGADGRPVHGLFTAGADMSDIYQYGYCGGLSAAAVTGTRAGQAAAVASGA
jgi:succinate dehydrogenase/fumarate reductase flavoprotein subunit